MSFKKDFFKPKNYLKLFYKPGKIFPAIRMYYHAYYNARIDIKYRELSDKQIISLYKNSLKALGRLASRSKKTLQIQTIEEVFGTGLEKNIECIQLGELFKTYGSDKSDHYNPLLQDQHNYYLIYFALLQHKRAEAL